MFLENWESTWINEAQAIVEIKFMSVGDETVVQEFLVIPWNKARTAPIC
jgi:hypothetical protein